MARCSAWPVIVSAILSFCSEICPNKMCSTILKSETLRQKLTFSLNFLCVILALVLILLELHTFLVKKPTSTEQTTTDLDFKIAPEILFCLQPAFQLDALNKLGYNGIASPHNYNLRYFWFTGTFQFFFGNIGKTDKRPGFQYGWSNIRNQNDIDKHFSILHNVSDLVNWAMMIYINEKKEKQYVNIKPKFHRLSYPLGRCLR